LSLSELLQEIRDRLLLRIHFAENPWGDDTSIAAALFIVQAWSRLDPQVESQWAHLSWRMAPGVVMLLQRCNGTAL
jgi:hypothetical protein